jgi:hypothetical protein
LEAKCTKEANILINLKLKILAGQKEYFFECAQNDFKLAFSKELPDILKKDFYMLKSIYEFLCVVDLCI